MSFIEEKKYLKKINFKNYLQQLNTELKNKKILIYGAGILLETALDLYDFKSLNIIGISDKRFESENVSNFRGLKTFKPDEIKNLDIDYILLSMKEYTKLTRSFIIQYPKIKILPLFKKPYISTFERRNININLLLEKKGLHGKKPKDLNKLQLQILDFKTFIKKKLRLIEIPQIEFNLTTKCTLRCKHCSNFIPCINPNEHSIITIDDFKNQVDNLLKAVHKIQNLLLIGGEPLLVKNLDEYLEYAASKKKIKRVWIVTNGTLLMKDKLVEVAKKYRNKITIWVSNYSKNEDLKEKLRHEELLKQINDANLDYDYKQDLNWGYTSPICTHKKRENQKEYFENCGNPCVAVFDGKIYVCPRAGVFELKGIYKSQEDEVFNLNNENNAKILKEKLIKFYSRDYFSACDYCLVLEDKAMPNVIPAIQIKNEEV